MPHRTHRRDARCPGSGKKMKRGKGQDKSLYCVTCGRAFFTTGGRIPKTHAPFHATGRFREDQPP